MYSKHVSAQVMDGFSQQNGTWITTSKCQPGVQSGILSLLKAFTTFQIESHRPQNPLARQAFSQHGRHTYYNKALIFTLPSFVRALLELSRDVKIKA